MTGLNSATLPSWIQPAEEASSTGGKRGKPRYSSTRRSPSSRFLNTLSTLGCCKVTQQHPWLRGRIMRRLMTLFATATATTTLKTRVAVSFGLIVLLLFSGAAGLYWLFPDGGGGGWDLDAFGGGGGGGREKMADLAAARLYELIDAHLTDACNDFKKARWDFATNITEETRLRAVQAAADFEQVRAEMAEAGSLFNADRISDPDLSNIFRALRRIGPQPSEVPANTLKANELKSRMEDIYSTATICDFKDKGRCGLTLKPDVSRRMRLSRDPEELLWFWEEWRRATGRKLRPLYQQFLQASDKSSLENRKSGFVVAGTNKSTLPTTSCFCPQKTEGFLWRKAYSEAFPNPYSSPR
ncbi:unnamed protein product [Notodromas monacha]|uniref:Uncharacterized protein n=1 Tax=Notodromas monacha TaxID=399045 RepID=A0A7R9G9P9_9CRUS|nr:unnamed protein product [Notodromas monacha]CAG0914497.1 unnamed protein product [Notodromas monacha]